MPHLTDHSTSFPPAVVCMAAGKSQIIVIQKARELGYAVLAVDKNSRAPGFAFSDEKMVMSTYEASPIISKLRVLKDKYQLVGVLNRSSGVPVVTAAKISKAFMLPGASPDSAHTVTDKAGLMAACKAFGISAPDCQSASSLTQVNRSALQYPCVVKPALSLVGKSGVHVVSDATMISESFNDAREISMNGMVNIEEYAPGRDLSLLALVVKGKLHKIVLRDELNFLDANGKVHFAGIAVPSVFSGQAEETRIMELADQVVNVFGLDRAVLNLSCRCETSGTPKLIEIHLDIGGDLFYEALLPKSTHEDVLGIIIKALAGDLTDVAEVNFTPAALLFDGENGPTPKRSYIVLTASDRGTLETKISKRYT